MKSDEGRTRRGSKPEDALDFEELYKEFASRIRGLATRRLSDPHLAEDVVQETLIKAYKYQSARDKERQVWPWLWKIASNACSDLLSGSRTPEYPTPDVEEASRLDTAKAGPGPEELYFKAERLKVTIAALAALPPRYRRILLLKHAEGWSSGDIAGLEATSVDSVDSILKRARHQFRESYAKLAQEKGLPKSPFAKRKDGSTVGLLIPGLREMLDRLRSKTRETIGRTSQWLNDTGFAISQKMLGGNFDSTVAVGIVVLIGLVGAGTVPSAYSPPSEVPSTIAASPEIQMIAPQHRTAASPKDASSASPFAPSDAVGAVEHQAEELGLNLTKEETPEDTNMYFMGVSPNYEDDHTLYASGIGELQQNVLFVSRDGGATWTQLPAAGFLGGGGWLVLAPGSSENPRIFSMSWLGLQESIDGGRTFLPKLLSGPEVPTIQAIVPSSAFETDRRLIIFTAAAGISFTAAAGISGRAGVVDYWPDLGLITPTKLNLPPGGSTLVGVSPAYAAEPVMFVSNVVSNGSDLYQCNLSWCERTGWDWTVGGVPRSATFSSRFSEDGIVFVSGFKYYPSYSSLTMFVSTDGARTFRELGLSKNILLMTVLPAGHGEPATSIATMPTGIYKSADNGGTWAPVDFNWRWAPRKVIATPTGRLFALLSTTGLACSENRGLTWARRCTPEP